MEAKSFVLAMRVSCKEWTVDKYVPRVLALTTAVETVGFLPRYLGVGFPGRWCWTMNQRMDERPHHRPELSGWHRRVVGICGRMRVETDGLISLGRAHLQAIGRGKVSRGCTCGVQVKGRQGDAGIDRSYFDGSCNQQRGVVFWLLVGMDNDRQGLDVRVMRFMR